MKSLVERDLVAALLLAALLAIPGCAGTGRDLAGLSPQRTDAVLAALSQVGTPYVFGGNEPGRGLDCSGLMQYAHQVAGVPIPRMSTDQRRSARPVDRNHPRPGDLVFFQIRPGVHHVGLMVDSERFAHASTSKSRVQLATLKTPYWQARYLGAGTYLE